MTLIPILPSGSGDIVVDVASGNNLSVNTLATNAGWDGQSNIRLRVNGDLGGPLTQDVDGVEVRIIIASGVTITGAGGDGADQNTTLASPVPEPQTISGDDGTPGIVVNFACLIENEGTIAGGGNGGDVPVRYTDGTGGSGGGGGGAGVPFGEGGTNYLSAKVGADGTATTGGAGGGTGTDGGDLGDQPAITGYSNVTYSGGGTLIGGTA